MTSQPVPPATRTPRVSGAVRDGVLLVVRRTIGDVDEVDDLVQEIVARALEAEVAGRIPPDVEVGAFVYGITRHVLADWMRARRPTAVPLDQAQTADDAPTPLEALVRREDRAAARRALAQLAAPDRELLERCFLAGEQVSAIARALGEPPARIRKRKSRALARLRDILGSHTSPPSPTVLP